MFLETEQIRKFKSKEKPKREVLVQFDRDERYNSLISEAWCPLSIRMEVAKEPAETKRIIVLCETDGEAIATAKYHYYSSGNNFKIIN